MLPDAHAQGLFKTCPNGISGHPLDGPGGVSTNVNDQATTSQATTTQSTKPPRRQGVLPMKMIPRRDVNRLRGRRPWNKRQDGPTDDSVRVGLDWRQDVGNIMLGSRGCCGSLGFCALEFSLILGVSDILVAGQAIKIDRPGAVVVQSCCVDVSAAQFLLPTEMFRKIRGSPRGTVFYRCPNRPSREILREQMFSSISYGGM